MGRAAALVAVSLAAALAFLATDASASKFLRPGIYDDQQILYGNPDFVFPQLQQMGTKVIRTSLWWGNVAGVARNKPSDAEDPADPAYNWETYDRTVLHAQAAKMQVIFTVIGTPRWANRNRSWNVAPIDEADIQAFARAAARRYSGGFTVSSSGQRLPAVKRWVVWNEPNNPVFLRPQFKREGRRWVMQSARDYARICNAVVAGIRSGQRGAKIACGATSPRGNNNPNSIRPSIAPGAFIAAMKNYGAAGFNAIAHHPYYGQRNETPDTPPAQGRRGNAPTAITLGNFQVLINAVNRAYGRSMRIWVTEYGYQTNPPDKLYGVTETKQAEYMKRAYLKLKRHPRVDYFIWFLIRDEGRRDGWESGVFTKKWKRKEARETFETLWRLK